MDYRNGTSTFSKLVDDATEKLVEKALDDHIRLELLT
jgi:hypothetical protein